VEAFGAKNCRAARVFLRKIFVSFIAEIRDKFLKMQIFRDRTSRKDFLSVQVKKRLDFLWLICLNTSYLNMGEV